MIKFFACCAFVSLCFASYAQEIVQQFITKQTLQNQQYKTKINQLAEQITQLKHKLDKQNKEIKSLQILLNTNLAKATAATSSLDKSADIIINKQYRQARYLILSGQYQQAIKAFNDYLSNNTDASNIAEAQFWLASSYAANSQFDNSVRNYLKFIIDYPTHHKIPEALYNLSIAQNELGQPQKSVLLLKSVLRRFPQHKIIPQVKESLRRLALVKQATKTL